MYIRDMQGCFGESDVLRLLDGRLTPVELGAAEQHLDGCADCRALVAATAAVMPASGGVEALAGGAEGDELPRRVGRYLVRARVGAGGMGTVFAAFDPQLGRRVALKLLKPEVGHGAAARARLVREAQAMARLQHANVVTVHDLGVLGEQLYFAMELVQGSTLGQWLRAAPRDWRDIVRNFVAAGRGLEAAHGAGIVHRDFKPENVLVAADGAVRVTDFGVARVTAVGGQQSVAPPDDLQALGESLTVSGTLLGTPAYMAPEQLMGDPVDARADIFSYCASLYEAVYGQRPFGGHTLAELRAAVCRGDVRPPPTGRGVPDAIWRILERGLKPDRNARHPSMAALLEALESTLAPARARWRRSRRTWALVATSVVALGALTLVALRPKSGKDWARAPWQRRAIAAQVNGSGTDAPLARVLDERLRAELALGAELRVIPAEQVAGVRTQLGNIELGALGHAGRALFRDRLGAALVLDGRARTLPDGRAQLTVDVRDVADGRPRAWVEESALPDALGQLTAQVAARVRQQLALQPPPADEESRVRAAFPARPDEAQRLASALEALRHFDADSARQTLEALVAADPQQPLAWAALADAWQKLDHPSRQREAARQAFERAGQLPREQRLWVEAQYREATKEWPEAIELYRTLATFFPDNLEYGLRLVNAQISGGRANDANATLDTLARLPLPAGTDPRIDMARATVRVRGDDLPAALALLDGALERAQAAGDKLTKARIRFQQCEVLDNMVRTKEALAACSEAENAFAAAGDRGGVARATSQTANILVRGENPVAADAHAQLALAAYRAMGSEAGVGRALMNLANAYKRVGKLRMAERDAEQAVAVLRETREDYLMAYAEHNLAAVQTDLGEFDQATPHYREAAALARKIGLRPMEAQVQSNFSLLLLRKCEIDEALRSAERSVAIYRELSDKADIAYALDALGKAQLEEDMLPQARASFEEALRVRQAVGWAGGASRQNLAEELMVEGQLDRAEAMARQAVTEEHGKNLVMAEAFSRAILAAILVHEGKREAAAAMATEAERMLTAAGTDQQELAVLSVMAEVKAARGQVAEARRDLNEVIAKSEKEQQTMELLTARFSLAELEVEHRLPTARQTLAELQKTAAAHHMKRVLRETAELEHKLHAPAAASE